MQGLKRRIIFLFLIKAKAILFNMLNEKFPKQQNTKISKEIYMLTQVMHRNLL
jgi:hypothetical protein